jgi:hypothetical protein
VCLMALPGLQLLLPLRDDRQPKKECCPTESSCSFLLFTRGATLSILRHRKRAPYRLVIHP